MPDFSDGGFSLTAVDVDCFVVGRNDKDMVALDEAGVFRLRLDWGTIVGRVGQSRECVLCP